MPSPRRDSDGSEKSLCWGDQDIDDLAEKFSANRVFVERFFLAYSRSRKARSPTTRMRLLRSWSSSSRQRAKKDMAIVSDRLKEALEWRKEVNADEIAKQLNSVPLSEIHTVTNNLSASFLERFPWFIYGKDKDGDPVLYATLPKSNAATGVQLEELQRGRLVQNESTCRVHRELKPGIASQHRVVINMSNLSLSHVRPSVVRSSKKIVEPDYYFPGICKAVVLIKLSGFARGALKIALKLIPSRIMRKAPLFGKPLSHFVDPEQIPVAFGGKATDPVVIGGAVFPLPN